jgi:hypothetical protein
MMRAMDPVASPPPPQTILEGGQRSMLYHRQLQQIIPLGIILPVRQIRDSCKAETGIILEAVAVEVEVVEGGEGKEGGGGEEGDEEDEREEVDEGEEGIASTIRLRKKMMRAMEPKTAAEKICH